MIQQSLTQLAKRIRQLVLFPTQYRGHSAGFAGGESEDRLAGRVVDCSFELYGCLERWGQPFSGPGGSKLGGEPMRVVYGNHNAALGIEENGNCPRHELQCRKLRTIVKAAAGCFFLCAA